MAGRIRSIKPEILDDGVMAGLSDTAWRLLQSMKVLADDYGNVRAGDWYLAAQVWQDTTRDVEPAREELARVGKLQLYAVAGERFAHIVGWEAEQRIDNRGKPRVPTPEQDDGTWNQALGGGLAEARGDSPRISATLGGSPLRACARLRTIAAGSPITDHRSPITDHGPAAKSTDTPSPSQSSGAVGRSTKGTRIPEDWQPSAAVVAWAAEEHGIDALACVEEFRDHWGAESSAKACKLDWNKAFRNRIRTLVEQGRAPLLPEIRHRPRVLRAPPRARP